MMEGGGGQHLNRQIKNILQNKKSDVGQPEQETH